MRKSQDQRKSETPMIQSLVVFRASNKSTFATVPPIPQILPRKHVIETLKTIKASNCSWIHNGTFGAINGALPGCKQDLSCCQAEEFWVGVNYALASTMIAEVRLYLILFLVFLIHSSLCIASFYYILNDSR